ncbi:hypothetical protein ACFWGN_20295 [Oerskovia sp. NPDC060338]|uniref:hypothetical protein n=1 Tax=Oerskovia sp. NPDC060338 TaxID=3347100 RepID=UPI003652E70E
MALPHLRPTRSLAVGAVLLTSVLLVSGCSAILGPQEAQRDEPGGEVTAASDADVFSLQIGDCVNQVAADAEQPTDSDDYEEVSSMPVVPCGDPHTDELYAEKELEAGDYPGDEAIASLTEEFCLAEFEGFVGLSYEESSLDIWPMLPVQVGWETDDDRVVQCFITAGTEPTTGSLKGSAI